MRSEVMLSCGKPVIVDAKFLRDRGITDKSSLRDARKACVGDIMGQLTPALEALCLVVPPPEPIIDDHQTLEGDWKAFGTGVTAARIHLRGTTDVPLNLWA